MPAIISPIAIDIAGRGDKIRSDAPLIGWHSQIGDTKSG